MENGIIQSLRRDNILRHLFCDSYLLKRKERSTIAFLLVKAI